MSGAEKLLPFTKDLNFIIYDGDKIRGNTLFRPGISDYNPKLVPEDFVLIFNKDKENLIALGRLIVGSHYIKNSKTGKIVKIYEKSR